MTYHLKKIIDYTLFYLTIILFLWIVFSFEKSESILSIMLVVIAGWFTADLLLSIAHLLLDFYPLPENIGLKYLTEHQDRSSPEYKALRAKTLKPLTPMGKEAFGIKVHHLKPMALTRRSFFYLTPKTVVKGLFILLFALALLQFFETINSLLIVYLLVITFGLFIGQYIHSVLHYEKIPFPVHLLQQTYILYDHKKHDYHHKNPVCNFALLNGWSDWLMNPIAKIVFKKKWLKSGSIVIK